MTRVVFLEVMNACTHRTSQYGSRVFLRMSSNRIGLTISKAPEMSIERSVATCRFEPQIICIYLVSSSNAISVDLPALAPIWVSSSRWFSSTTFPNRLAMKVSITFPIVLSRAIGLHAPRSEYLGFSSFRRAIVRASLNC